MPRLKLCGAIARLDRQFIPIEAVEAGTLFAE